MLKSVRLMQCILPKNALGILHFIKKKKKIKSLIKYAGRANKRKVRSVI